jgi:hypothetical protein
MACLGLESQGGESPLVPILYMQPSLPPRNRCVGFGEIYFGLGAWRGGDRSGREPVTARLSEALRDHDVGI